MYCDRFAKRYRQYSCFLLLCGILYGVAFFRYIGHDSSFFQKFVLAQKNEFRDILAKLLLQNLILWLSGCSMFASLLGKIIHFSYGFLLGMLASFSVPLLQPGLSLRPLAVTFSYLFFSAFLVIDITLLTHSYAHTQKTALEKEAFFPYTYRMILLTAKQILLLILTQLALTL